MLDRTRYDPDETPGTIDVDGAEADVGISHSDVLDDDGDGPGRVTIHGRGWASLLDPLGSAASHGCVRVDSAGIRYLARVLTPGVPVVISP